NQARATREAMRAANGPTQTHPRTGRGCVRAWLATMLYLAANQEIAMWRCPMDREPIYTEFRQKIRERYHDAMVQLDLAIDLIITRSRAQIDRTGDPVSPTDVQNLLEAAIAVYTAKCGPLERSNAAFLIRKAIYRCLHPNYCEGGGQLDAAEE